MPSSDDSLFFFFLYLLFQQRVCGGHLFFFLATTMLISSMARAVAAAGAGAAAATRPLAFSMRHLASFSRPSSAAAFLLSGRGLPLSRLQRGMVSSAPAPGAVMRAASSILSSANDNDLRTAGADAGSAAAPASLKRDIYQMSEQELGDYLKEYLNQPRYRAKQVYNWLFTRGASSFEEMNDLPKVLRAALEGHFKLGVIEVAFEQTSKDGTIKRAYRLGDGQLIESVLMPYEDGRRTACISSQCGCAMGCVFCATGQNGMGRQLTEAEIFQQALFFSRDLAKEGLRLSNVVFMGEGEPLNNRKAVFNTVRKLHKDLGIGARHITISTVGLVPRIRDLADMVDDDDVDGGLFSQIKLAVSLHAANDAERSALMPVNRRFPISQLMEACQYYVKRTNRRITFEWALISGENGK